MKRIALLTCLLCFFSLSFGQNQLEYPIQMGKLKTMDVPTGTYILPLLQKQTPLLTKLTLALSKIAGLQRGPLWDGTNTAFFGQLLTGGYLMGTGNNYTIGQLQIAVGGFYVMQTYKNGYQHAKLEDGSRDGCVKMVELIWPSIDNGLTPLYRAVKVGAADNYDIKVHPIVSLSQAGNCSGVNCPFGVSQTGAPASTGIYFDSTLSASTYTVDDLIAGLEPNKYIFPTAVSVPDSFWIYVQVDKEANDDTIGPSLLDIFAQQNTPNGVFLCGENLGTAASFHIMQNGQFTDTEGNVQRMQTIQTVQTATPSWPADYLYTNVLLMPVYEFDPDAACVVSRDRYLSQDGFNMYVPFPNPTSSRVSLKYELLTPGRASIKVYDNSVRLVENIDLGITQPGVFTRDINTSHLATGNYYIQLEHAGKVMTQKFQIVR